MIAPLAKDQTSELISALDGGMMREDERKIFAHFIGISTTMYHGSIDGKLICLWGLIPPTLLSDQAYLWLYTTPAAEEHQFTLVRRSQIEVKKMLEVYPKIVGHCEVGAERSIRWLKWLGAKFGLAENGLVPFVIERQGA
jgi:hypothetical protein